MKKNKINPKLKPGDRIILVHMQDEGFSRVSVGSKGKVLRIGDAPRFSKDDLGYMYHVEWYDDDGKVISTLSLLPEVDGWIMDDEFEDETDLNESKIENLDDLERVGNILDNIKRSELQKINNYLELIRQLGIVNMFEAGQFIGVTKQYFDDYMKLQRYTKEYDEDLVEEISDMADEIRNIIISIAIKMTEKQNKEVTIENVKRNMSNVINYMVINFIQR